MSPHEWRTCRPMYVLRVWAAAARGACPWRRRRATMSVADAWERPPCPASAGPSFGSDRICGRVATDDVFGGGDDVFETPLLHTTADTALLPSPRTATNPYHYRHVQAHTPQKPRRDQRRPAFALCSRRGRPGEERGAERAQPVDGAHLYVKVWHLGHAHERSIRQLL